MDNSALDQLTRYWNRMWNVCQVRWHRPNAQWRRPPGRPHNSWLQQINNGSLRGIRQSWRAAEDRGHRGSSLRTAAAYALRWWWWICSIYASVTMQDCATVHPNIGAAYAFPQHDAQLVPQAVASTRVQGWWGRALWVDCPPAWLKRIGGVL